MHLRRSPRLKARARPRARRARTACAGCTSTPNQSQTFPGISSTTSSCAPSTSPCARSSTARPHSSRRSRRYSRPASCSSRSMARARILQTRSNSRLSVAVPRSQGSMLGRAMTVLKTRSTGSNISSKTGKTSSTIGWCVHFPFRRHVARAGSVREVNEAVEAAFHSSPHMLFHSRLLHRIIVFERWMLPWVHGSVVPLAADPARRTCIGRLSVAKRGLNRPSVCLKCQGLYPPLQRPRPWCSTGLRFRHGESSNVDGCQPSCPY
ncbi:hypothetical protein EXIGLDRAFT_302604 [Exidia glandulosa HHB12029]|uniref:Uncharacterized protein n=1 Tax=Exidia glandulosa HHB12029 TaxID=1314781 RepID=A0A165D6M8_EXIGL|nr:hypothetical protein EXIGLDRAFT_302604 [Exidia glandulosa HHB12029]